MAVTSLAFVAISLGCKYGVFSDCTKDMDCSNFIKMYSCWHQNFSPIQTPLYKEALKRGKNVPIKIAVGGKSLLDEFLPGHEDWLTNGK